MLKLKAWLGEGALANLKIAQSPPQENRNAVLYTEDGIQCAISAD